MSLRITFSLDAEQTARLNKLAIVIQEGSGVSLSPQQVAVACYLKGLKEMEVIHNVRSKVLRK